MPDISEQSKVEEVAAMVSQKRVEPNKAIFGSTPLFTMFTEIRFD